MRVRWGPEGEVPGMGFGCLAEEEEARARSLSSVWGHRQDTPVCQPEEGSRHKRNWLTP